VEAIKADFVPVVVTSVMAKFVVVLRDTVHRAVLTMPAVNARLTSVIRTGVMPSIIVARNALRATLATKPRRQTLFLSIGRSAFVMT